MTPTCDTCGAVDETVEWCGSCGCCVEHCQQFVDCPISWSELASLSHETQVERFGWCACEDGPSVYEDCPSGGSELTFTQTNA